MNRLKGNWHASTLSFGLPSDVEMTWQSVLDDKYVQILYKITMHANDGTDQLFEGTAFYKPNGINQYKATWFDSTGDMHPISAVVEENSLVSSWGTPETKMGKTTYKIIDFRTVEVIDLIQKKDGSWKQFNRAILTKK